MLKYIPNHILQGGSLPRHALLFRSSWLTFGSRTNGTRRVKLRVSDTYTFITQRYLAAQGLNHYLYIISELFFK